MSKPDIREPTAWAILRSDAPFAYLFPDRRVPLRQPESIRPRDDQAPACFLVAGLAADLYALWQPECASVEEAAAYIRQDLPLRVAWFEALDLGLGQIVLPRRAGGAYAAERAGRREGDR